MEDPEEIIEGVLFEGANGLLYGERNVGKTFLSLDMAMRVALGWEWFGRRTRKGTVFYIYAEAPPHLKKRVGAFLEAHGLSAEDLAGKIYFYPGAINLMDPNKVAKLVADLKRLGEPTIIFIDTLAKNTVGSDDSNNMQMGQFIDNLSTIRDAFPYASQVIIHHPGHNEKRRARGAYNLIGGTDFEFLVSGKTHPKTRTLECVRQHEGPCFPKMTFTTKVVGPSLVVAPVYTGPDADDAPPAVSSDDAALAVLSEAGPEGLSWSEWLSASGLPRRTFGDVRTRLCDQGAIRLEAGRYVPAPTIETVSLAA